MNKLSREVLEMGQNKKILPQKLIFEIVEIVREGDLSKIILCNYRDQWSMIGSSIIISFYPISFT